MNAVFSPVLQQGGVNDLGKQGGSPGVAQAERSGFSLAGPVKGGVMKVRSLFFATLLIILVTGKAALADHLVLKDGKEYSGKFVRGDAGVIEFRILGRVETFKTSEVDRVIFKEPEISPAPTAKGTSTAGSGRPASEPPVSASEDRTVPPPSAVQKAGSTSPAASGILPAGTPITIRTTTVIDTDRNRVGDSFDAVLEEALTDGDQIIAPRGAEVKGNIAWSRESGRLAGQSELILELKEIMINGKMTPIRTSDYTEVGSSRGKRTATAAGGGAALGAIIGAIAGGGKGAAIGAATGAAVGTGAQILTKGQTLKVPAETILEFKLQSPLTVPAP